ncbi:MAG: hypothetical protein CL878_09280 [Dehalococcoidia bacterium]|nr:hypothetical protein [Dehalococcoidia bacterium]
MLAATESQHYRAASLDSPGTVAVHEYERQPVLDTDAVVEIEMCGVCGSDVHWVHANEVGQAQIPYPFDLGHEWVGRVVEKGSAVPSHDLAGELVDVGDRVWVMRAPCGKCYACAVLRHHEACIGRPSMLTLPAEQRRVRGWGFADIHHAASTDGDLSFVKVAEHVAAEAAVLLEPLTNALTAIERSMQGGAPQAGIGYGPGATVVVQGAGPIGALIACVARLTGADRIIVVGAPANRLELVKDLAADEVINIEEVTDPDERVELVREMTPHGLGPDVVYEAAGVPIAWIEALQMVRQFGTIVEVGHFTPRDPIPFDPFLICSKACSIYGHYGLSNQAWVTAAKFLARHWPAMRIDRLVTNVYPLDQLPEAIENMRRGVDLKAAIRP